MSIKMQNRIVVIGLVVFGMLLHAQPSMAQSEGMEFTHSPNALRDQREHHAALDELVVDYFKSLEVAEDRFAQASIGHIRRYTDALNRSKTQHTRAGKGLAASLVEAAIERAAGWTFTAPDAEGKHFLTDADLVVAGDDEATKLGTDLLGRINRLGVSYQRQADGVFSRYEKRVQAAQQEYIKALEKTLTNELRAGRHKAVIQIEDGLKALNNQDEVVVERPDENAPQLEDNFGAPLDPDASIGRDGKQGTVRDLLDKGYPESMRGIYVVHFPNNRSTSVERLIMVLREDGGEVVGWYYQYNDEGDKFKLTKTQAKLLDRDDEKLIFYSKSGIGRDMIFEIHAGRTNHSKAPFWTSADDYKSGKDGGEATAYKLWKHHEQEHLKDGKYELKLQASTDPDGKPAKGEVTIQIELIAGQAFRPAQRCKIGTRNWTLTPAGFTFRSIDAWTHFSANSYYANQPDVFHVENAEGNEPLVKYWWSKYDKMKGKGPDMIGKVVPVEE